MSLWVWFGEWLFGRASGVQVGSAPGSTRHFQNWTIWVARVSAADWLRVFGRGRGFGMWGWGLGVSGRQEGIAGAFLRPGGCWRRRGHRRVRQHCRADVTRLS